MSLCNTCQHFFSFWDDRGIGVKQCKADEKPLDMVSFSDIIQCSWYCKDELMEEDYEREEQP